MSDSEDSEAGSSSSSEVLDLSLPIRKRAHDSGSEESEGPEDLSTSGSLHPSKNPKKSLIRRYCKSITVT